MRGSRGSLADLLTVTLLAAVVGVPIATALAVSNQATANRVKCASNLKQIGLAMMLYANENRGKYPRTSFKMDAAPVWGTPYEADHALGAKAEADPFAADKMRPADNDVTAALFLLLRTEDLVAEVFICPSTKLKPMKFDKDQSAQNFTNWTGNAGLAAHLSYSYQNPYPTKSAIEQGFRFDSALPAEFVLMADMNPGGDGVTGLTVRSTVAQHRTGNSLNHGREGQNILYADGHIEWNQNPLVGMQRDNIYTANGPEISTRANAMATIVAAPADPNDTVLLPTAADIGQTIQSSDAGAPTTQDDAARRPATMP